jgi:hypothetical protein
MWAEKIVQGTKFRVQSERPEKFCVKDEKLVVLLGWQLNLWYVPGRYEKNGEKSDKESCFALLLFIRF